MDILVKDKKHRIVLSSLLILNSSSALEAVVQKTELPSKYEEVILLILNQEGIGLSIKQLLYEWISIRFKHTMNGCFSK